MRMTIVGAGYVGLVTAACLADVGHTVEVVERDRARLDPLRAGRIPLYEPDLASMVARNVAGGTLSFTDDMAEALRGAQMGFLAVGTPAAASDAADDRDLLAAAEEVAHHLRGPILLVNRSTAPVGTHRRIEDRVASTTPHPVPIVVNPEFLRQGQAVRDFRHPDRVVIGATDRAAARAVAQVFRPFAGDRIAIMDPASAELTKYAANTMLALRVAFVNELATLCAAHGGDIGAVTAAVGQDPRIGTAFLAPSLGYGGSCLPKDVRALAEMGRRGGTPVRLAEACDASNTAHLQRFVDQVRAALPKGGDPTVAVWGIAFKAGTDDLRQSATVHLVDTLLAEGVRIRVHDPLALEAAQRVFGDRITPSADPLGALDGASALVIGTAWSGYCAIPPARIIAGLPAGATVVDGRNLYPPDPFVGSGIGYVSLGRPPVPASEVPCPASS